MQNEWDLGVKTTFLTYNMMVHSSTGQTPFFASFGREATLPVHWVYTVPKANREMALSAWRETMQERFQTTYAGMREKQQESVRRNAPMLLNFRIGDWVWLFDPKVIPGS